MTARRPLGGSAASSEEGQPPLRPPSRREGAAGCALTLSPRLGQIAAWVPPGRALADVGTDHAYLPVWLRLRDIVPRAVASDLRPGPLERARQTARRFGATNIQYRLCPGLRDIAPQEAETVVLSGMGGQTLLSILQAAPWVGTGRRTLLLQPQSHEELVRQYLSAHGFSIVREAVVEDRGLYIVLQVQPGRQSLTQAQIWAGAALPDTALTHRYRREKRRRLERALAGLEQARRRDEARIETVRGAIAALNNAQEVYAHDDGA